MSPSTTKHGAWSRTLFWAAASMLLCSLVSCGLSLVPNRLQPNLPMNGSVWKMISLSLFVFALLCSLCGVMTAMFEQVERRSTERMRRELEEGLAQLSRRRK